MFGGAKQTFGQTSTGGGFGFNNTATASPFSQSFGKPATTAFGQSPAFGQQNTTLFGTNQPVAGGGLFGTNPTPAFGAPATTQQPAFGGFQQTPQTTSLFSNAQQQNAASTSLFGQSTTTAFGAAKPSGFAFAQAQQPTSLFGQATTANTAATNFGGFGQNATSGGMFSTTNQGFGQTLNAGATGTAVVKYQESMGTDTLVKNGQPNNVNTKQHCITAMKEYEGKSLEELRFEDYLANRKGPQAGATGGLFGQNQPATGGLFGTTPQQQQSTGLFGQQQENKSLFGTTNTMGNTTGFGQQQNTEFGATGQASTSVFAKPFAAPATSNTGFTFSGTDTANNPFGAKPFGQATTTSLFGRPAQPVSPAFGQTTTGFGGFGATNTQQPTLFGNTGTENKPTFGLNASTANTAFSNFGANTNTSTAGGGFFGNKPATGFGATPAFGAATSTATGFGGFGNANQGSLFNSSMNKSAAPAFGGFCNQSLTAPPGGMFGMTAQSNAAGGIVGGGAGFGGTSTLGGFGNTNILGSTNTLGEQQKPATLPIHQQIMPPVFSNFKPLGLDKTDALKTTISAAQKAFLESTANHFKASPIFKKLFEHFEENDSTVDQCYAKSLIINPANNSLTSSITMPGNSFNPSPNTSLSVSINISNNQSNTEPRRVTTPKSSSIPESSKQFDNEVSSSMPAQSDKDLDSDRRESWLHPNALDKIEERDKLSASDSIANNTISELVSWKCVIGSIQSANQSIWGKTLSELTDTAGASNSFQSTRSLHDDTNPDISLINTEPHPTGIILHRKGYYTIPSLDDLSTYLCEDGTCIVPNFTIGRQGYGNVFFGEPIDVAELNLDEIVHLHYQEVIIYPDDENKPPLGSGLNRKAQITLDQVWPHDKTLHEPIKDPDRLSAMDYKGKLRRVCDKHDTQFIEYRPETGSWVFKVDHFSKYGVSDSDEDEATDPKKQKLGVKDDPKQRLDAAGKPIASKSSKPDEKIAVAD